MSTLHICRTSLLGCITSLLLTAAPALANPPEGKGHGPHKEFRLTHGKSQHHEDNDHQGNDNDQGHRHNGHREHYQGNDRRRQHDEHHYHHGPRIDEDRVRVIFRDYHHRVDHHHDYDALPPGIRKNLRRGKPLPPGIAKKFDPHLHSRLPHYDGYEWHRVGRDAVLVEIATRNIHLILEHILD